MEDLRRSRVTLGATLQMADLLFRGSRLVEHGGRRLVRLHDQSSDRPVLDAGSQYDPPEFIQTPVLRTMRSLQIPGDTIFFCGAAVIVAGLKTGHSFRRTE